MTRMSLVFKWIASPVGPLKLVANEPGLVAIFWGTTARAGLTSVPSGNMPLMRYFPRSSSSWPNFSWASCLALTQQLTGGAVIRRSIAEGIGNDQSPRDGRQHFGRIDWREPFRNQLFQAHLEKSLHFPR